MSCSLYWFRNDLRITDNPGLAEACRAEKVLAVYCFNPAHYGPGDYGFNRTGPYRARFLIETVSELRKSLDKIGIPLFVFHKAPGQAIPDLVQTHGIGDIHLQREWTRDEQRELEDLKKVLPGPVQFFEHYNQFLYHPADIPFETFSNIPDVFTAFRKKCEKEVSVRQPLPAPAARRKPMQTGDTGRIPGLEELGLDPVHLDSRSAFPFSGGWPAARARLNSYFWETRRLSFYKHTRNGLLGTEYSSKFSPWLANGSLSPREIYWEVRRYESEVKKNQDTYWLIFELLWRDYFKYVSLKHGNRIFHPGGILERPGDWGHSAELLQQWTKGETESDFVNANMKELSLTGWMSNRGRQNVASYWSQTLGQDWRLGAAWFEYLLIDYDVHSNWGNWMYNSAVGNDPRNRSFNPELQARRYDADGRFRRTWLQPSLFENPVLP